MSARRISSWTIAGVVLCALLGALIGLGTFTFVYAEGGSYLSNDPTACVNCHVMRQQYDGWQHARHHAVAVCVDCHVPHDLIGKYYTKAKHGWGHSRAFTMQDFHEPIRITETDLEIVEHNCLRCHTDMVSHLQSPTIGGQDGMSCTHCHKGVGH